jgi:hypothetical protein
MFSALPVDKAHLILKPVTSNGGTCRQAAVLIQPDGAEDELWWEVPEAWTAALTPWADPWVVGLIFPIMRRGRGVHVEGRASPSLLANLELFMRIWSRWAPDKYRVVEISADAEVELPPAAEPGASVASFSGGVDSCFTVYRHARELAGRRVRPLRGAVVQHGFDVWLDQKNSPEIFARMLADATTMLASVDVPCIPIRTNFQQMRLDWADAWGTQLVSGLYLLAGRYDTGLIANEVPYQYLGLRWASHPVTNQLLGSRGFTVVDDGGEFTRIEKAKVISDWPEAMRYLHVCFGVNVPGEYRNCCRCEKCIRTMLAFRIAGCERPSAFAADPTDAQIRGVRLEFTNKIERWEQMAEHAEAAGMGQAGWVRAMRTVLRKHRWREFRNVLQQPFVPLRNRIRKLMRGTELSRSEMARTRKDADDKASSES